MFSRGMVNETLERHLFNSRKQDDGEKFDDFLTDLKILSKILIFVIIVTQAY